MSIELILKRIRDRAPLIWIVLDKINSLLISITWQSKISLLDSNIDKVITGNATVFYKVTTERFHDCVCFLANLSEEDQRFFRPFQFDEQKLIPILLSSGFRCYCAEKDGFVIGFFFLRLAFNNTAFLGFVVDGKYRGCGIGSEMIKALVQACKAAKIRLYSSVSDDNPASMKAHLKHGFRKLRGNDDGYWLLEST